MLDDDTQRLIRRYLEEADRRERAANKNTDLVIKAVTAGLNGIAKEINEGFTRLEHTIIDRLANR